MLDHILATWPAEWRKWSRILSEHAYKHFALDTHARAYLDLMQKVEMTYRSHQAKEDTTAKVRQFFDQIPPHEPQIAVTLIKKFARFATLNDQAFGMRRLVREMAASGEFAFGYNDRAGLIMTRE
jgi:hypothetical protein